MKNKLLLFLAFISFIGYSQNPSRFANGVQITGGQPTTVTPPYVTTTNLDGLQGKITPENIPINQPPHPINYTAPTATLGGHLIGIDTRLGHIGQTTAGQTNRIYFTGDNTTVNSIVYFASNATGKGSTPSASPPNLVNGDDQKQYFTKDIIGIAQPANTISAPGIYSGQLSVMVDSDIAQERYTIEVYKTNNLGVPIASGITGAPVGDLGVTVITILDSGVLDLSASAVTNITVSGILTEQLTLNAGERVRYHVSAAKVGTAGSNVTFTVYYGSNYSSYYDVPVTISTNGVRNDVPGLGLTASDALEHLNSLIPVNYTNVVYVNNANPNSATIFDLNNPPTVNDNGLKTDVNNLYIANDASTWVYNSTSLNYVTKTVTSATSNFYTSGTTADAGNSKISSIVRPGKIGIGTTPVDTHVKYLKIGDRISSDQMNVVAISEDIDITGDTSMSGLNVEILGEGVANSNGRASRAIKGFGLIDPKGFNMSNVGGGAMGVEGVARIADGATGTVNVITGLYGRVLSDSDEVGITVNFGNGLVIPPPANLSATKWGRAIGVNINAQNTNTPALQHIDLLIGNGNANGTSAPGLPSAKDYGILNWSLSDSYFRSRFSIGTTAFLGDEKLRVLGTIAASSAVTSNEVVIKSQLDLKADLASPILTGNPTAPTPTAGDNDTSIATTAFVNGLVSSGTFTPTATPVTNVTSVSVTSATYIKIGNIVQARYGLDINVTSDSTGSEISLTLPINRSVTTLVDIGGGGVINPATVQSVVFANSNTVNSIKCTFYSIAFGSAKGYVNIQYSIN